MCPYTPQQNGVLEHKHQNLLEMAWELRFQASLPISGEAILTANYIINKLPNKVLDNKTTHEVLFGKKLSYKNLKVFGCLAYVFDSLGKQDKIVKRGRSCMFLGYLMGKRGIKPLILKNENIYISINFDRRPISFWKQWWDEQEYRKHKIYELITQSSIRNG